MSTSKYATAGLFFCVLAGCWLASIPIAEVVFRLLGDTPSPDMQGLFVPFAKGSYKLGALVDTQAFYASGPKTIHTDGLGLRCDGERRFAAKPGDAVDVLVLGDSQGFGNGVNFEESIGGTLAEIEAKGGYRVSNASVGGHNLPSQYELARWLVDQRGLKVAKFVVFITPAMINSGNRQEQVTVGDDGRLYGGGVGSATLITLWIKTHLVIYSRVRDAVRNSGIGVNPAKASSTVFEFYQVGKPTDAIRSDLLAGVKKLQGFASEHGANIYLVYVPLTVEADFGPLKQAAAKSGMDLDPNVPLRITSWVAERLHVPLYNLKPVLEKIRAEGRQLNVTGDFHYSPILSKACGSSLAAELKLPLKETQLARIDTRR
jgi:hypothetical protein